MDCPSIPLVSYGDFSKRMREKLAGKRIPLLGSLEVTYRCNLRCVHCYLGERRFQPEPNELTTAEIKNIIDQVVAEGCLWFLITGGEPFVRPDILDILRYAKQKGLLISLFTNGTMLTPQIIKELAAFPPFYTEITLYGLSRETYERVTGIPGSHARCLETINLLKSFKVPFKLKTVLMTLNYKEYQGMRDFANELGVGFRYDPIINATFDQSAAPHEYRIPPDTLVNFEQADEIIREAFVEFQARTVPTSSVHSSSLFSCGAGKQLFHIDPFGNLSPCLMARWQTYSLRGGSFKEGWNAFLKQVLLQKETKETSCTQCNLRSLCGQCAALSMVESGNTYEPSSYLCKVAHLRAMHMSTNKGIL